MSTANKRTSISDNLSENRLQKKLHENYKRFLTEADEDAPIEEEPIEDDGLDLDSDLEDDMPVDDADLTADFDPIAELGNTEQEQVEDWVDEILGDSLDQVEDENMLLDTEAGADDLDPMGDDLQIHDDLPLSVSDLTNIIDDEDSIAELEAALAGLAEEGAQEENIEDDVNLEDENNLPIIESEEMDSNEFDLLEAEDPMKGIDDYFDQGFEGKDVKDELSTDKSTPGSANKFKGIDTDPTMGKTKETPGGGAENNVKVVQESKKRAAMLIKAADVIAKQVSLIEAAKKQVAKLQLENYKLNKANGILSEAADIFSEDARVKIAEGFDKCANKDQINKFFEGLVSKIKENKKSTLNEAVNTRVKNTKVIRENKEVKEAAPSREQQRINMLMGLPTQDDPYFA